MLISKKINFWTVVALSFVVLFFFGTISVYASVSNGTIDTTNKTAKFLDALPSSNRINFGCTNCGVQITDTALTGYAWSEGAGWIHLNPSGGGGVSNSTSSDPNFGVLSGYAWGENTGWINFQPANGGVKINTSGQFTGYAWAQNYGWILFDCGASACVGTDWRPLSVRGHGGFPPTSTPPTTPPVTPPITPPTTPPTSTTPPSTSQSIFPPGSHGSYVCPELKSNDLLDVISNGVNCSYYTTKEKVLTTFIEVKKIANDPKVSTTTKIITTTGVAVGASAAVVTLLFASPLSFGELFLIPLRLWGLLMVAFGLRKKNREWGTVYDSITKQPLDPAYLTLYDIEGKEITSAITDIDGRYSFLVPPGTYKIIASKTNYNFPSVKLSGKLSDELYHDLYTGDYFNWTGDVISKNIPLDSVNFDWNEFAKSQQSLTHFYSKKDPLLARISNKFFYVGFAVAILALLFAPRPYNLIIFGVYVALLLVRRFGLRKKKAGMLIDKVTNAPLSFAVVRIFSSTLNVEIAHKVADIDGKYLSLVAKGNYYITIEKKNPDQSYTKVFTSEPFETKNGLINSDFSI